MTDAFQQRLERRLASIESELKSLRDKSDEVGGVGMAMEILGYETPRAVYKALRDSDKTEHPIPRYRPR